MSKVRLIKHEAVSLCGSYEIRFPDGRPSKLIYWEDSSGSRLRPDQVGRAVDRLTERVAKIFVRAEQHVLNFARRSMKRAV